LNEFFELDQQELENKVITVNSNQKDEESGETKFYQIKKKIIELGESNFFSLAFYDVSTAVKFE